MSDVSKGDDNGEKAYQITGEPCLCYEFLPC